MGHELPPLATEAKRSEFNIDIQALRGVSIALVVYYHAVDMIPGLRAYLGNFADFFRGGYGVDLFFVISGYVITRSMYRHIGQQRITLSDSLRFWKRRAVRTLPPALAWLGMFLVLALATRWFGPTANLLAHAQASALQYANFYIMICGPKGTCGPFGYYWTLSTEEQFYMLLPLLTMAFAPRQLRWIALAAALILGYIILPVAGFGLQSLPVRMDGLLLGVCLALFKDTARMQSILAYFRNHRHVAEALALGLHAILWTRGTPMLIEEIGGYIPNGLVCALLVLLSLNDDGVTTFSPLLRRGLAALGTVSYSMYLCHVMVILGLQNALAVYGGFMPSPTNYVYYLPILTAILVAISWASYRWIESPCQLISKRLTGEKPTTTPTTDTSTAIPVDAAHPALAGPHRARVAPHRRSQDTARQ